MTIIYDDHRRKISQIALVTIIIEIEERIPIRYPIDLHTFMFIRRSS